MAEDETPLLNRGSSENPVPMWAFESRFGSHADLHVAQETADEAFRVAIEKLGELHWADHDQVHLNEGRALSKALDQATVALAAALEAHRREHEIEKNATDKSDIAHQQRHEQMNEIRAQLNDQATTFVQREILDAAVSSLNREISNFRDQYGVAHAQIIKDLQITREEFQKQIAALREVDSAGGGRRVAFAESRQNLQWSIGVGVIVVAAIIGFIASHVH